MCSSNTNWECQWRKTLSCSHPLGAQGCSAAILHYLSSTDMPVGYIALTAGSWRDWGLKSITPKCVGFKFWNSGGWAAQESEQEQELRRLARRPVLNHSLEGKADSIQSFYTLAFNISRKVHALKCKLKFKWYFLGPSDTSNLESFRCRDHWLRDFAPTYSLMTDQITHLRMKNIMQVSTRPFHHPHLLSQQWLCDTVVFISSLALGHGCIQIPPGGNGWHLLCLKPWFLRTGCLGELAGDEAMAVRSQSCF